MQGKQFGLMFVYTTTQALKRKQDGANKICYLDVTKTKEKQLLHVLII